MAKRFGDTELWDKEWFMNLTPELKCLVEYVKAKSNIAGIWHANWTLATAHLKKSFGEKDLTGIDGGKQFAKIADGKFYCIGFIEFQYGEDFPSAKSPVHKKVISLLKKDGLTVETLPNRVVNTLSTTLIYKEEEKEEYKEEEESEEKEEDPQFLNQVKFIIKDLNEKAGTEYRPSTRSTQALIRARIREGFTVSDFEHVHSVKCTEWLTTDNAKYLRPETLYGTKFESYKNQRFANPKTTGGGTGTYDRDTVEAGVRKHFAPKQ